jgi:ribosome-associated toxin RatA of RatAB toxin-antitoxin module
MIKYVQKIIFLTILLPCATHSDALVNTDFDYFEGTYTYEYSKQLNSSREQIFRILTDYEKYTKLNPNVQESRLISAPGRQIRRLLKIRQCIFFFCFNLQMVEEVTQSKFFIESSIVKDESNFLSGLSSWELVKINDNNTLVRLKASQTPAFWIPPFIGPTLIKSVLFRELEETFTNLQILASS